MGQEQEIRKRPLMAVLCENCVRSRVLMALGQCSECGNTTSSCSYMFCADCATEKGVCPLCGGLLADMMMD